MITPSGINLPFNLEQILYKKSITRPIVNKFITIIH
jgi:hypothetical protein